MGQRLKLKKVINSPNSFLFSFNKMGRSKQKKKKKKKERKKNNLIRNYFKVKTL